MKLYYIYVIENEAKHIKIGITTNFSNRLKSLQGSNTGGFKIVKYYCSEPTPLPQIEKIMHSRYNNHRIKGTEWFKNIEFSEVVKNLKTLLLSEDYKRQVKRLTENENSF